MQILINGLISGLSLALLSVAFSVVYLPTRVFYLALAGIYTLVPFLAWASIQSGLPVCAAILLAIVAGTLLSVCCEVFNHNRLDAKSASSGAHLISSLGIYIVMTQVTAIFWGNETKVLRVGLDKVINFSDITLTYSQGLSLIVASGLLLIYYLWLWHSRVGLLFRALSDNRDEFALKGHSIQLARLTSFGISGFLCSVSALLVAYDIGFDAHGGLSAVLLAVVAVIVGGRQTFSGPVLGAICLGLVRAMVVWQLSAQWADAMTFAILALVLFVRPQGMLGSRLRLESAA